ncbi:MAG: glycosyltransferase family 4 protein [Cytophagaceae bacterium]
MGLILKFFYPTKKIVLITHGIEVWGRLSVFKKLILKFTYKVFTVSNYTKGILCNEHRLKPHKVELFPNAIDPFFLIPTLTASKSSSKFNLNAETKVLLTLSRLSFFERNKGYDVIIELMPELLLIEPNLKYIIAGKYDDLEGIRLKEKIADLKLTEKVILTGFVKEEELTEFYSACDIFVIPSKKEGFGIVFIEALVCGLQVIGGNKDGTVDALQNGLFGILVDPDCKESIKEGIIKALSKNTSKQDKLYLQSQVLEKFGYLKFKERLAIQINQMVNA